MKLPDTFSKKHLINTVVETPKASRNKYERDPGTGLFKLSRVLPAGTSFPFDFGFIPYTKAGDGDPVDVMIVVETECFPGSFIECRVIGVIKAVQKEKDKKPERNDRIIAVAVESIDHSELRHIKEMNKHLMDELCHFFKYYNKMRDREFIVEGVGGPKEALSLIKRHQVKN